MRVAFTDRRRSERGITIIVTAMLLTIIIPLVGLAIDAGTLYATKAKIQSAADAASMAAVRSLSTGLTLAAQETNCKNRADAYFKANFPEGTGGATIKRIDVTLSETDLHTRVAKVEIEVEAPAFFMRYLGFGGTSGIKVNVVGETSRRDVNIALVLDRSGSLESSGSCDDVETAAITFVSMFANQRDRMALVTFGGSHKVDYLSTKNFKDPPTLISEIDKLFPGGCTGWTGSAQGIWTGYQQLVATAEPGALNVIVFFTDGRPNTITANWPVKTEITATSPTGTSACYDWANGLAAGAPGWNPFAQRYLGWLAGGANGIHQPLAGAIPVTDEGSYQVDIPVGFSGPPPVAAASDCNYLASGSGEAWRDIAYIPDNDAYGNSIFGWQPVGTYSAGHPYAGKGIIGDWTAGENAAINALDNAAARIRARTSDPSVEVLIYSVGLGDVGDRQHELLRRVANDKASTAFDSSALEGKYIYAPSGDSLSEAFSAIAAEIMRFSK